MKSRITSDAFLKCIINRDKIFVILLAPFAICQKGMKDDICVNKSAEIEIDTDVSSSIVLVVIFAFINRALNDTIKGST